MDGGMDGGTDRARRPQEKTSGGGALEVESKRGMTTLGGDGEKERMGEIKSGREWKSEGE